MYLIVDSATSQVLHAQPVEPVAANGQTVISVVSDPLLSNTLVNPTAYWWSGTALMAWPSLTCSMSGTTVTVTLNATTPPPAWTSPASATLAVTGTAWVATVVLTNGTGTASLAIHPSLVPTSVFVTASATATQTASLNLGSGAPPSIGLQVYTSSGGISTIAPVGVNSLAFLRGYYSSLVSQANMAGDLATADSLALHTTLSILLPALVKAGTITLGITSF